MNRFLTLIILIMAGGGYYEYQKLHVRVWGDQVQIVDLKSKLESANATLALSGKQNTGENLLTLLTILNQEKAKEQDLARQLQSTQAALASAQAALQAAKQSAANAAPPPPPHPTFTTRLGTINTLDGKVYSNSRLLKVHASDIVISHSDGVTQIQLSVLPADVQKKLGFNPELGALSDDQVQALEQKVQDALAAGN